MDIEEVISELQRRLDPKSRNNVEVNKLLGGAPRHLHHVPTIMCADGFRMSVQASEFHYCSPRDSIGPWGLVEVGFPTERVDAFMPFFDGREGDDPTGTVYGYVPIRVVAQAIVDHGGFAQ